MPPSSQAYLARSFFPNDLRCGFRKLKEQGGGKSTFWSRPGAEIFVVIVIIMHAAAARDPILSTQRIREVKISMVGIDKVKVRLLFVSLAHVSHFVSELGVWGRHTSQLVKKATLRPWGMAPRHLDASSESCRELEGRILEHFADMCTQSGS